MGFLSGDGIKGHDIWMLDMTWLALRVQTWLALRVQTWLALRVQTWLINLFAALIVARVVELLLNGRMLRGEGVARGRSSAR